MSSKTNKINEENKLNFTWTKWLFALAVVLCVLGFVMNWVFSRQEMQQNENNGTIKIVVNIILYLFSLVAWWLSFYFTRKDFILIKGIAPKKWLTCYFSSNVLFFGGILLANMMYMILTSITPLYSSEPLPTYNEPFIPCLVEICISVAFGIAAVVLNLLSLYKIEVFMWKRKFEEKK